MSNLVLSQNQHGDPRAIETDPTDRFHGWVFYKHPDGQWVTLRKATHEELTKAMEVLPTALPRVPQTHSKKPQP